MEKILIIIIEVLLLSAISCFIIRIRIGNAIIKSKKHLEHALIYNEMAGLEYTYITMRSKGCFVNVPLVNEYLQGMNRFTTNGLVKIGLVKVKTKIANLDYIKELSLLTREESDIVLGYTLLLDKLHSINQPFDHAVLSVKKMLLLQILYLIVEVLIAMWKTQTTCGNALKSFVSTIKRIKSNEAHIKDNTLKYVS